MPIIMINKVIIDMFVENKLGIRMSSYYKVILE